jgi:hypothetical protein
VTLSTGGSVAGVNIWSIKTNKMTVHGKYCGVNGLTTPQTIYIAMDDGVSSPITQTVTTNCTAGSPCSFDIPNVAIPATNLLNYTLWIENRTSSSVATATLCVDSSAANGSNMYASWGDTSNGCPSSGGCAVFGVKCVQPSPATILNVSTGSSMTPNASMHVLVKEYYNKNFVVPTQYQLVRVSMYGVADGIGATLTVDSKGSATFCQASGQGVPLEPIDKLILTAWMTTTGYSSDQLSCPFEILYAARYDMEYGGVWAGLPFLDQQHTLILKRVSTISGTAYKSAGGAWANGTLQISNADSGFSDVVTTDASGRFKDTAVPIETTNYTVAPVCGADLASSPASANVLVSVNGITYRTDTSGTPLQFTLSGVNGTIQGKVKCCSGGGNVVPVPGAVVIASTYNGTFPTSLPATALNGKPTYSTVTFTDGTYSTRVATGSGNYYVYGYVIKDGVFHSFGPSAAQTVSSDVVTTYDFTIP